MSWRSIALGLLAVALLGPAPAHAQRGMRGSSGPAMTPYGPVYNPTQSPEYRLRAQNPAAYQQLMFQRQMQAAQKYQQQMLKQQQQLQKNQKGNTGTQDPAANGQGFAGFPQQGQMNPQALRPGMAPFRRRTRPKSAMSKAAAAKAKKSKQAKAKKTEDGETPETSETPEAAKTPTDAKTPEAAKTPTDSRPASTP